MVEYALILCLVPDDAQDEYELCGTNASDGDETATFVFKPSSEYIASEEFPLDLGPNETKCLTYTPTVAGVLSERVYGPPGLAKKGVTIISPSEWSAMARNTSTQVWLKANGKRAALVSLLLPAVQKPPID